MNKFNNVDEKDFLESYAKFTVEIRPYIIRKLCEDYKTTSNKKEQEYLYILAIEQFFLVYETLEGFFRAIKNRGTKKPILDSLTKNLNIQNLYNSLKNKTDEQILKELNIQLDSFEPEKQKEIKDRFVKLAGFWKEEKICRVLESLIPIFYKLKHKLMIYKQKDEQIAVVLDRRTEKNFKNVFKGRDPIKEKDSQYEIDYLYEMAVKIKAAILDLIAVRLLELK